MAGDVVLNRCCGMMGMVALIDSLDMVSNRLFHI
jgi:hypothetical protein